jgi:hypothetical protein
MMGRKLELKNALRIEIGVAAREFEPIFVLYRLRMSSMINIIYFILIRQTDTLVLRDSIRRFVRPCL